MAFHHDLLKHASKALIPGPEGLTQADLRRAVSTAYYAVFHLLIAETTVNWSRDSSRDALSRMFDHRVMAKSSDRLLDPKAFPFTAEDPVVVDTLRQVAAAFVDLQRQRHIADYDNATNWAPAEAKREVETAGKAFAALESIRDEKIAQEYLVSLLIKPRG